MEEVETLELNKEVMLRLIKALIDGEELEEIARIVSMDPNLSLRLLKFINSSYFSLRKEIKSITHAIAYLGYANLRDYIFIMLTSSLLKDIGRDAVKDILMNAFAMKYVAEILYPEHMDEAFLFGLLHCVSERIGAGQMKQILDRAGVSRLVIDGLTDSNSPLARLKTIVDAVLKVCKEKKFSAPLEIDRILELTELDLREICLRTQMDTEKLMAIL